VRPAFWRQFQKSFGFSSKLHKTAAGPVVRAQQWPWPVRIHPPRRFQYSKNLGRFQMLDAEQRTARCIHSQI
jgi:hypothetical protein